MSETASRTDLEFDYDVVVVGGGPAGCSAGVFTARYGLDTVVFDRGPAALPRCAFLENYPGFPAGIDVETFRDLLHAHANEAGCEILSQTVVAVDRTGDGDGFVVETNATESVTTTAVVAAAWYDGSYLRPLETDDAMFEEHDHHGEVEERFDPTYPDADGRTDVDGLYVASPAGGRSAQAIVAAGNGAHVARCLLEDRRRAAGYAGEVAPHYDWLRPESEFSGAWESRDRWREWVDDELNDGSLTPERRRKLRERYIDRAFETRRTRDDVDAAADEALRTLVDVVGVDRILEVVDEDALREHVAERTESASE